MVIIVSRPVFERELLPCSNPLSSIPNQRGLKLLALRKDGAELLLTVKRDRNGVHHLGRPLTDLLGWRKLEPAEAAYLEAKVKE